MAVVSRVATLRMDDAATHTTSFIQSVATAATQDVTVGTSVVITTVTSFGGAPPALSSLTLSLYDDAGTLITSFALTASSGTQTSTFTPAKAGTVEIALRATRTAVDPFDVETDGSPNSPYTGYDTHLDRGWIRATTTATLALSNVALGGAKTTPAQYDESLFVRTTLGADLYRARALTVALSGASPALSGATNSATTGNFDATFATVCDNRFPAAVTTVNTSLSVPNATLTGLPDTVLTATNDSMTVDPRLTTTHLLQLDNATFATPPISLDAALHDRLASNLGFAAARVVAARGTGINGVTLTETLQDNGTLVSPLTRSVVTATKGGQLGWSNTFQTWDSQLPGGDWTHSVTITAPADITGATYLVNSTDAGYSILSPNPGIVLRGYVNKMPGGTGPRHHFVAGTDGIYVTLLLVDSVTGIRLAPSRVTNVSCTVSRVNPTTEQSEILGVDETTFAVWAPTAAITSFAMSVSPNDARMYVKSFPVANTSTWTRDLRVGFAASIDGTPYYSFSFREETGGDQLHSGYVLDAVALALSGNISFK